MKAIVMTGNYLGDVHRTLGWCFIADSALSNVGKPFFLPEALGKVEVSLGAAVKISRLGKGIDRKFASRYYRDIAPALHFKLPEYAAVLREEGLPEDAAFNYDRSLMIGDFLPMASDMRFELWKNGEKCSEFDIRDLKNDTNYCIESVSVFNTLKMGDLLLPGVCEGLVLKEGDTLEVKHKGERAFFVKVK